ncbi:hypothetical protein DSL92_06810 [Billgrantia gudaonensis]|uniref:Uncharacterized protein n=1 Tax=Billgrantia gudaonensis TaxID=376427 RepID=A0A432JIK7_9GAMM|nr:hypothetical protein DSL92_06810 [Halomonas gudaonensis]
MYFVIKNHLLGRQQALRAFLFLLYLRQEGKVPGLERAGSDGLTLLDRRATLKEELMVRLVMNLIVEDGNPSQDDSEANQ